MNLVIDIGNTFIKTALFNDNKIVEKQIFKDEESFNTYYKNIDFRKAILCNVGKKSFIINDSRFIHFNHKTKIPIHNNYETKETLGLDRLAAVIGAHYLYPKKDILVIDCGSCITYDFITQNGIYEGGGISPGLHMKLKSLHNFTAQLPLLKLKNINELIGKSTETSILSGVINGTIAEISGIIQKYQNISDNLAPVLCGGDTQFISTKLNKKVIIEEKLVLYGLNEILKVND